MCHWHSINGGKSTDGELSCRHQQVGVTDTILKYITRGMCDVSHRYLLADNTKSANILHPF